MTDQAHADVLVIFGITGNLAKVMTFRSLYRLEARGLLACPIVGVAYEDWTRDQLVDHTRTSIAATGEPLVEAVFARLAARFAYVHGDFSDDATYARVAAAIGGARTPVCYLEVPPSLFSAVVSGLAGAGLTANARVVIEKPFGHDLASARSLATDLHRHLDESQIFRIDHYLGKMGLEEILYLRFANTMLEPVWNRNYVECVQITMAEELGVSDRGHFYDPVGALRDVVVNHLMQMFAAVAMEAPSHGDPETIKDMQTALFRATADADPTHFVRGQFDGYREIDGVAVDSTTETFCALRLEVENWRWAGVPFFIRAGKLLPTTLTEARLVFRRPPRLGFGQFDDTGGHDQLVMRLDPSPGLRLELNAHRADRRTPGPVTLDLRFSEEGGAGPTPYEVLLHAAITGNRARFARQDTVEAAWRVMQPLLDHPSPVKPYAPKTWGPAASDSLVAEVGGWRKPWR